MTGVSYILADVFGNGGEALVISDALLIRLAVWPVLGCVIAISVSFLVRNLRLGSALVGGSFGGVLAAIAFLLAVQRFSEMAGHLIAAGLLA